MWTILYNIKNYLLFLLNLVETLETVQKAQREEKILTKDLKAVKINIERKVKLAKKRPANNNFDINEEVQLTQKRLKMTTNQLGQNLTLISR